MGVPMEREGSVAPLRGRHRDGDGPWGRRRPKARR